MKLLTIDEIKQTALPIFKAAGINHSAIVGSYARGEENSKSDIDFLVTFPNNTTLMDIVRLKRVLENTLNKEVDLISMNALSPMIKDSLIANQYPIL